MRSPPFRSIPRSLLKKALRAFLLFFDRPSASRRSKGLANVLLAAVNGYYADRVPYSDDPLKWHPLEIPVTDQGETVELSDPAAGPPGRRFYKVNVIA